MKLKFLSAVILLFACYSMAFGQGNAPITKAVEQLKTFSSTHITEKAYLHFDKPYYAAGDTIYFKAYLTLGEKHELGNLSGLLHVDLINTNNKIDQSLKLQLANGVAWGDFALPDSLPKGNYRVRAYTRWMRNNGDENYFDQPIPVGSILNSKVSESGGSGKKIVSTKPDIQFFPEGGEMVTGISSKIAFKAVGTNGFGVNVKGIITDNENKEVATFASVHTGMGYFYLNPEEGKIYKAKITYADGSQDIADLPKFAEKGIVLSVNNDSVPKASVRISASKTYFQENKNKEYSLVILSAGIATTVPCTLDSNIISLDILKRHLHTGIATVTLFSPAGEPLCERLLFVQNYGQLNLTVNTDKNTYSKREKVNIKLNALTRADSASIGHFSVSVIDESKVPVDENNECTILTNLLLTSDLKGYVEQPNYYFANITGKTQSELDLVMLTHGYRRFDWKKLLNNEYPAIAYQPENSLEISGQAKNAFGKPLVNGTVSLISLHGGPFLREKTDDKGMFHFSNLLFTDSVKFMLQAVNARGKNSTTLIYNKEMPALVITTIPQAADTNPAMADYIENMKKQHEDAVKYGTAKGILLKEVQIKQKKFKEDIDYPSSNLGGPGHADQVIHRSEFRGGGVFSDQFNGILRGVGFIGMNGQRKPVLNGAAGFGPNSVMPMLLVLDGSLTNLSVDEINVNTIETIEVLKPANAAIYGMGSAAGVLVITTRQGGMDPKEIQSVGVLPITAMGFYKARGFYAPKYEHPEDGLSHRDLRTTIYWNPEIQTGKEGNASLEYYNADGTGNYRVVIEGIDEKGNLGRQVYRYKVE
jgi:TonB-dependent Receptor Plug Domain